MMPMGFLRRQQVLGGREAQSRAFLSTPGME